MHLNGFEHCFLVREFHKAVSQRIAVLVFDDLHGFHLSRLLQVLPQRIFGSGKVQILYVQNFAQLLQILFLLLQLLLFLLHLLLAQKADWRPFEIQRLIFKLEVGKLLKCVAGELLRLEFHHCDCFVGAKEDSIHDAVEVEKLADIVRLSVVI